MSRVAPQPDEAARRRTARGTLILGILICVPRLVLVWFARPVVDILQVATTLLFVGGLLVIAVAIFRYKAIRGPSVWPLAVAGVVCVLLAGVLLKVFPAGQAQLAYDGGVLAPPAAIAYQYGYVALGGMSQLGLMLIVGAIGVGITNRRSRRAS
ncbi:MAG: hypothetical protein HIU86_02020 [Acidobacteria bacterium]|nr:hypothetical protein [Acidobacteriota bacterium]